MPGSIRNRDRAPSGPFSGAGVADSRALGEAAKRPQLTRRRPLMGCRRRADRRHHSCTASSWHYQYQTPNQAVPHMPRSPCRVAVPNCLVPHCHWHRAVCSWRLHPRGSRPPRPHFSVGMGGATHWVSDRTRRWQEPRPSHIRRARRESVGRREAWVRVRLERSKPLRRTGKYTRPRARDGHKQSRRQDGLSRASG
jgi:hypothetical protein